MVLILAYLARSLDVPESTSDFVASVMPGMESGWYQGRTSVETREECHERARVFAERVRSWAADGSTDNVILVSHGDLMDCILKHFALFDSPLSDKQRDQALRFVHSNTGITRVGVSRKSGRAHILAQNILEHLEDPTLHTGGELEDGWTRW